MKRRAFLAGFLAAPWLVRQAFGDASLGGTPRVTATEPTLVLVVPKDAQQRWDRGTAFGEFLNYGRDRDLAPLGAIDVVCAPAARFGIAGDPLMLYVEHGRIWQIDGVLPQYGGFALDAGAEATAKERIELLSALIREVVPRPKLPIAQAAGRARARWVNHAPPGGRWMHAESCGSSVEGEERGDMPDCGMAHVPAASARFLDFLVKAS
jgi:hypothetical protein